MVFVIVILLSSMSWCAQGSVGDSPVETIEVLRHHQLMASYNEYYECEKKIAAIKFDHGVDQRSRLSQWEQIIAGLVHVVPLIIWQLIALLSAIGLVWLRGHSFFLFLVLLISCSAVLLAFQERTHQWLLITEQEVSLHLGPHETYPMCGYVHCLEEVRVTKTDNEWRRIQKNGTIGWMRYV